MRVFMLGIAVAVAALMPSVCMANDQQIADYVKAKLQAEQQNGNLNGFNVDMRVDKGAVLFSGFVSSTEQEQLILKTAQDAGHLGVTQVIDDIEVRQAAPAQSAQVGYQQPVQVPAQVQYAQTVPQNRVPAMPVSSASNQPLAFAGPAAMARPAANPGAAGGAVASGTPNLPGYAWPGYAAHPNYSAVTYPKQYSPSAWPYIGPFYPYPQVPMGWRKVSLEWSDGWWFLDFSDTNQW